MQELLTTNMMMNSSPHGSVVESRYLLTELTRLYLNKRHPLTGDEDYDFEVLRRQLEAEHQLLGKKMAGDPYDYQTVSTRSKSDYIVAKYLLEALKLAEAGQLGEALGQVEAAKQLAADYYEVYRIQGQLLAASKNLRAADEAFRAAIDIEPVSAPLRLFYAAFLREGRHDVDSALAQVDIALKNLPDDPYILLEHARCNLDILSFETAKNSIDRALVLARKATDQVDVWQLNAEYYQRLAGFSIDTRNYARATVALVDLQFQFEKAPVTVRDQIVRQLSSISVLYGV